MWEGSLNVQTVSGLIPLNTLPTPDDQPLLFSPNPSKSQGLQRTSQPLQMLLKGGDISVYSSPEFHCPIEIYSVSWHRQVQKSSFEKSKNQVLIALTAYLTEMLRRFGLWTLIGRDCRLKRQLVKKPKGHREAVMKEFDTQEKEGSRSN